MACAGPTTLSLFSGIGGLDIAWEIATGGRVVAQCEADPWRRSILAARWPDVPVHSDVRRLQRIECEAVIGGFPCQPFSTAARGRNRQDNDLWPDMLRVIRACNPRWVFAENVLERPIERAATDLARDGYVAAYGALSSVDVGAPHDRRRWWLVADADPHSEPLGAEHGEMAGVSPPASAWEWSEVAGILGMGDGTSARVDRRHQALGDAVVPLQAAVAARLLLRRLTA